jgi:hypothetical protein
MATTLPTFECVISISGEVIKLNGAMILEKLIVTQLLKKLPTFYGTQRFITMFITAHHWSLS